MSTEDKKTICYTNIGSFIKYYQGDVFSPNRTGHECIVCIPTNCMGMNDYVEISGCYIGQRMTLGSVKYHAIKRNGFDYNIASMFLKHCNQYNPDGINLNDIRKAFQSVYIIARPLPIRTLTTVRIPYKLGYEMGENVWSNTLEIIFEELVNKDIPVEIWQVNSQNENG